MSASTAKSAAAVCGQIFGRWQGRGIVAAYLYGSILGPRRRRDSDVDLAVLDSSQERLSWADQSKLMDELERALGQPVDLRMLRDCALSHQAHILQRGQPIWTENHAEMAEYARAIEMKYEGQQEQRRQAWSSVLRKFAARVTSPDESRLPR